MINLSPRDLAAACLAAVAFDHRVDLDQYTTEEAYGRFHVAPYDAEAFANVTNQNNPGLS